MALINDGKPFLTVRGTDFGLTRKQLSRALAEHGLRTVFQGVVVDSSVPDSRELRLDAAALVLPPHAIVSDHTAAWLWGAETRPPGRSTDLRVMCTVPHSQHRVASARVWVRQVNVPDSDAVEVRGVRITSPLRTATDLLRLNFRPYALAAADAMVRAGAVSPDLVAERARELRCEPYSKQARELATVLDGEAASHGESWMRCRLIDAGFSIPTLQHRVVLNDGRWRDLDAAFLETRTAAEFDGREHHSTLADRARDAARREEIASQRYWHFVIATSERIFGTDASFEHEVGALIGVRPRPRTW